MNKPSTKELLLARRDELAAERTAIKAQTAAQRVEREKLIAQANELNARVNKLTEQLNAAERPRLIEVMNEHAAVARALGAYRLTVGEA